MLDNHRFLSEHTEVLVYESCDNKQSSLFGHEIDQKPALAAARATEHRLYQVAVNACSLQRKALRAASRPERVAEGKSVPMSVVAALRQLLEKCRHHKRFLRA